MQVPPHCNSIHSALKKGTIFLVQGTEKASTAGSNDSRIWSLVPHLTPRAGKMVADSSSLHPPHPPQQSQYKEKVLLFPSSCSKTFDT